MDVETMKLNLNQTNKCWKIYKKYASKKYSENIFNLFNRDYGLLHTELEGTPMEHVLHGFGLALDQVWTEQEKEDKHNES